MVGIIFLAIQAVERDWLGPSAAVIVVAVLSLGSAGYSLVAHHRSPTGPIAPALFIVGTLGLLCNTWAITFGMTWIDDWLGVSLMTVICAIGLCIAWLWNQLWLDFTIVTLGGVFLLSAASWSATSHQNTPTIIGCLLVLGMVGWASTWHRNWIPVDISSALLFVCGIGWSSGAGHTLQLTVVTLCAISVTTMIGIIPTATDSSVATTAATLTRWVPVSLVPVAFLLGNQTSNNDTSALSPQGSALAIALTTCAIPIAWCLISRKSLATTSESPHRTPSTRSAPWTQRGYQLPLPPRPATIADTMRAALGTGLTALAIILTERHLNSEWIWWLCALITVSAALIWFSPALPASFTEAFSGYVVLLGIPLLLPAIDQSTKVQHHLSWLAAGLYLALGVMLFSRATTLRFTRREMVATEGILLLLGSASIPLLAREINGTEQSFMIGHLAVSVLWMLLSVFFLLLKDARIGLAIAMGTTGKLVFYDLATLDGLIKVAAFILCGLTLLICATVRHRSQQQTPADAPRPTP